MTKKDIKGVFREHRVQLSSEALQLIEDDTRRRVRRMALRCKEGNVKRLTSDVYFIAIGRP